MLKPHADNSQPQRTYLSDGGDGDFEKQTNGLVHGQALPLHTSSSLSLSLSLSLSPAAVKHAPV